MAAPLTPTGFFVSQGNGTCYTQWDLATGATSYSVYRSTDGVTYSSLATPAVPYYLDESVTVGTTYYYKVASVNSDGTSAYTDPESAVPTATGEMSLGELRLRSQQRADRVNSDFITKTEWNSMINQSLMELYDILITAYEDMYVADPIEFDTDGTNSSYALPNGTNYEGAPAFYKILGVDLGLSSAPNGWVTVKKFNFIERNKYVYPNTASTIYGVYNLSYRVLGSDIHFIPLPNANQPIRIWYIPRLTTLLADNDVTDTGVSGWLEYVICDSAIKALQKEESDVSVLLAQKQALIKRIQEAAQNRDAGQPDTISDVQSAAFWSGWNGSWRSGPW